MQGVTVHPSRLWRGAFIALLIVGISGAAAHAHHGDAANSGRLYTPIWQVCNDGAAAGVAATEWAMNQISITQVTAHSVACAGAFANVYVSSYNYPENWYGLTSCSGSITGSICSPAKDVRLNARTIATTRQWQKTSLHELGHVAGLGHRPTNTSAMTQGDSPPVSQYFDFHDREAINASY